MKRFGRRSLFLFGIFAMGIVCLCIGIVGFVNTPSAPLAVGILMILLNLAYNVSIGPVCYAIVAEISSSRLRAKTVSLARASYNLTGLITNTITPRMIDALQWNWGARAGLFYLGLNVLLAIYMYFRLPETKGRPFHEIDLLYQQRVSPRKFAETSVAAFDVPTTEADEKRSTSAAS